MKSVEEIYECLFDSASSVVKSGEQHIPLLFVFLNDGTFGNICIPENEINNMKFIKEVYEQSLNLIPDSRFSVLITEVWHIRLNKEEVAEVMQENTPIAAFPERREAILFHFMTHTRRGLAVCEIDRTDNSMKQGAINWKDVPSNIENETRH